MQPLETLDELARELDRVVVQSRSGQDIQISHDETTQLVNRLHELRELRKLVFGDDTVVADAQKIEEASRRSDRELLHKAAAEEYPDAVLRLLLAKMQSLVRCRRECEELKDELRDIRRSLLAVSLPYYLRSDGIDDQLAERHPTLALADGLRNVVQELAGIISEKEGLWESDKAFEAADLRLSIEGILEDQAAEDWSREDIVRALQDLFDAKYVPMTESRILIEEVTEPFRKRAEALEQAARKAKVALAAKDFVGAQSILSEADENEGREA